MPASASSVSAETCVEPYLTVQVSEEPAGESRRVFCCQSPLHHAVRAADNRGKRASSLRLWLPIYIPVFRIGGAAGLGAGLGQFLRPFAALFGFDLLALVEALRLLLLALVQKHAPGLAAHGRSGGGAVVAGTAQGGGLRLSLAAWAIWKQDRRQKQGGCYKAGALKDLHSDFGLSLP